MQRDGGALCRLGENRQADMTPSIPENAWLDLVTLIGVPPRKPNDNDDDDDEDEDEDDEDEGDDSGPAVIREPDE
jgi:hypothetical protein